jgi:hypothetical protein
VDLCTSAAALDGPIVVTDRRVQVNGGKRYLHKLYDMFLIERLTGAQRASGITQDPEEQAANKGKGAGRGGVSGKGRGAGKGGGRGGAKTRKEQGMYKCGASRLCGAGHSMSLLAGACSWFATPCPRFCSCAATFCRHEWREFACSSWYLTGKYVACRLQMLNATADEEVAMAAAAHSALNTLDADASGASHGKTKGKHKNAAKRARAGSSRAAAEEAASGLRAAGSRIDKATAQEAFHEGLQAEDGPLLEGFHLLAIEDANEDILHKIKPLFVILYDLDLAWIRQLEVFQSLNPSLPVKVHTTNNAGVHTSPFRCSRRICQMASMRCKHLDSLCLDNVNADG